jgi:hypothetical protein
MTHLFLAELLKLNPDKCDPKEHSFISSLAVSKRQWHESPDGVGQAAFEV